MASLLALAAALMWGAGDFFGGISTRRIGVLGVLALSEAVGLAALALWIAARGANLAYWGGLTGGPYGVWVADDENDEVLRIHGGAGDPNAIIPVDHGPTGMLSRGDSIWVAASLDGTIDEIDPKTSRVVSRTHVGSSLRDLIAATGGIWVTFADTWAPPP